MQSSLWCWWQNENGKMKSTAFFSRKFVELTMRGCQRKSDVTFKGVSLKFCYTKDNWEDGFRGKINRFRWESVQYDSDSDHHPSTHPPLACRPLLPRHAATSTTSTPARDMPIQSIIDCWEINKDERDRSPTYSLVSFHSGVPGNCTIRADHIFDHTSDKTFMY